MNFNAVLANASQSSGNVMETVTAEIDQMKKTVDQDQQRPQQHALATFGDAKMETVFLTLGSVMVRKIAQMDQMKMDAVRCLLKIFNCWFHGSSFKGASIVFLFSD